MGKVMRHTLGASLNIRHNLSSSKGPKPLQLKLLTTYIPKTSAFTLALVPRNGCGRPGRAPERFLPLDITSLLLHVIFDARFLLDRKSGSARMPRPISYAVFCLKKKNHHHVSTSRIFEQGDRTNTFTTYSNRT